MPLLTQYRWRRRPESGFEISEERFRALVSEAIDALPEEFARAMDNVVITVEDLPEPELAKGRELFGVYIGVPLTARRHWQWGVTPDKIVIYRVTICSYCRREGEVRAQVYRTVIHEIAHHFGIGDGTLEALGW